MNRKGFTLIELIMIIVILGILAVVAIPRYIGLQNQALVASEQGVVGAVRGGIHIQRANILTGGGTGWPASLETTVGDGFAFEAVLEDPGVAALGGAGNWTETAAAAGNAQYTGPTGTTYTYNPTNGSFQTP